MDKNLKSDIEIQKSLGEERPKEIKTHSNFFIFNLLMRLEIS